ncbi:MAG: type II/IV secretion system ATPase subunit [Archaeoglobaceae archaeon]|nr:type II/IV secretion system ATPase subunit [Archaeoglobaceae archaeon]MDW7990062.1 type II/IV secretion system ATPase subunit [Archaeoglobaceae archaeon]
MVERYRILRELTKAEIREELNLKNVVSDYYVADPFIRIVIVEDMEESRLKYHVIEPSLSVEEVHILSSMIYDLRRILSLSDVSKELEQRIENLLKAVERLMKEHGIETSDELYTKMLYYFFREFFGYSVIEALMLDPNIEDISCDGYEVPIFVYHKDYGYLETNIKLGRQTLDRTVLLLTQRSNKHISVANPIVDATLPDGSRLQATYGTEVTPRGSSFTIRKFTTRPLTPLDLIRSRTVPLDIMTYLWLMIEHKLSAIIVGETASGKTTTLNAMLMFVPPEAKVVSIEDTREIKLYHENWLAQVTRTGIGEREIDMYDLLKATLRQRPDYIVVGEVRGKEALTLFQAMSTGHASYSTFHAGDINQMVYRFENDPLNVPRSMLQFLNVVLVQNTYLRQGKRIRRTREVNEILGVDPVDKNLLVNQFLKWDPKKDEHIQVSFPKNLEKIALSRGDDVFEELERRKKYLEWMIKRDIRDYKDFTKLIHAYYRNPELAFSRII